MPTVWPVGTEPMFSEEKEDASSGARGAGQKPCLSHRKRGKGGDQQRAAAKGRGPGIWNQCQLRVYPVDPRISHTTVKTDVFFQSSPCICCNVGQRWGYTGNTRGGLPTLDICSSSFTVTRWEGYLTEEAQLLNYTQSRRYLRKVIHSGPHGHLWQTHLSVREEDHPCRTCQIKPTWQRRVSQPDHPKNQLGEGTNEHILRSYRLVSSQIKHESLLLHFQLTEFQAIMRHIYTGNH